MATHAIHRLILDVIGCNRPSTNQRSNSGSPVDVCDLCQKIVMKGTDGRWHV